MLEGRMRVVGIVLFALIMSLNGFVFGVISIQLVPLLEAAGLAGATAVWVASLKGHGQFAGRLVEIFFGRNLKAMTIARIAIAVVPASLILLFLPGATSPSSSPSPCCSAPPRGLSRLSGAPYRSRCSELRDTAPCSA